MSKNPWDLPPAAPAPPQPWPSPGAMASIPPFKLPDPPALEPESASVQMLRELLASRRTMWANSTRYAEEMARDAKDTEELAATYRKMSAGHLAHAAALDEEIERILADIKKLGGRKE